MALILLASSGLSLTFAALSLHQMSDRCYCCTNLNYAQCCQPYHLGTSKAATPEILMRSRYSAYALHLITYLVETTHPSKRHLYKKKEIENWAVSNRWLKLEICKAQQDQVEFKAYYQHNENTYVHHENSTFKKEQGIWYYLSGSYFD